MIVSRNTGMVLFFTVLLSLVAVAIKVTPPSYIDSENSKSQLEFTTPSGTLVFGDECTISENRARMIAFVDCVAGDSVIRNRVKLNNTIFIRKVNGETPYRKIKITDGLNSFTFNGDCLVKQESLFNKVSEATVTCFNGSKTEQVIKGSDLHVTES